MKAVVILSGGMDSSTALHLAVYTFGASNVSTITFNYGSKHNEMENKAAKLIADSFGVGNKVVSLPFINELFKSDLLKSGGEIPEGHYADPTMVKTVVPFRNTIMLSIAAGYCESVGAKQLWLGNHFGDHAVYPDCRKVYVDAMAQVLKLGGYLEIELVSPFCSLSKTDICRLASCFGTPLNLTYSCYKGGESHCGKCGTCFERKEAFKESGTVDLTTYLS